MGLLYLGRNLLHPGRDLSIKEGTFFSSEDLCFKEETILSRKGHLFLARNITFHQEKDFPNTETNSPCQPLNDKYLCDKLLKFLV